ncbi:MAG: ABC transporter substrate-binding protein [Ignavibacteriaceae bacterium]
MKTLFLLLKNSFWAHSFKGTVPVRFLSVILSLSILLSGCDKDESDPVSTDKTEIKIGALFSISSGWVTLGINSKAALQIAEQEINSYLNLIESDYTIKMVIEETSLNPATALEKLKSLKSQGVQIVIGPQTSAEVRAIKEYADSNDIMIISQSSTAFSLAITGDNIFRLCPDDIQEGWALANLMRNDGISGYVSISRNDDGNLGISKSTKDYFESFGGSAIEGPVYDANTSDFTQTINTLRTMVTSAIEQYGQPNTAVQLSAFDESADLFALIKNDPVLTSVKWYGSDGTALINAIISNNDAAVFANTVNYMAPIFGLDDAAKDKWEVLIAQIKSQTNIEVDAFTLAAYDAARLAAQTYVATGFSGNFAHMKTIFPNLANSYFGTSGWISLNEAGDRKYGNFDFWGICSESGALKWKRAASFSPASGGNGSITYFGCQ